MGYYKVVIIILVLFFTKTQAQTSLCNGAAPFCTGSTYNFPAPTGVTSAQSGVDYGCLNTTPNPVWYYLKVATSGVIVLNISGASSNDDIDFACWGPFTSPTSGCTAQLTNNCGFFGCTDNTTSPPFGTNYPSGNLVDCSYDPQAAEICTIPNAIIGQYYLVLITNFANNNTNIIFNQTNSSASGSGSTDCSIVTPSVCGITTLAANPSACNTSNNTYSITGSVTFTNAPTTGSLVISSSCGGSQIIVAPFTSPTNYTLTNISSNGASCNVNASFSAASSCTKTISYTAPAACSMVCIISSVTANASICDLTNNTYSVTGNVLFTNAPTTGSLVISNSCGGSQIITAPFTSPITYTLIGITSNGSNCTINAHFTDILSCFNTTNYTAPIACVFCVVTSTNNSPICELESLTLNSQSSNAATYSWVGPNGFTSAAASSTISTVHIQASGIYTVTVVSTNSVICTATTNVVVEPLPSISYSLTIPQELDDYTVSGISSSTNATLFYWVIDNKQITTTSFSHDFGDAGNYQICIYTENSLACPATECINVELKQDWSFYIPNSFSPNDDGINDLFSAHGYGITDLNLDIFDRWGTKIYSGHTIYEGWNGIVDGSSKIATPDVYTWKVKLRDINGKTHDYVGHVALLK